MASRCFLRCCSQLHPDIPLPDGVRVTLGREPKTKVKDKRCSREQLACVADYARFRVRLEQLGANASAVNGKEVGGQGAKTRAGHGDKIELLSGQFAHRVHFDPPPPKEEKEEERQHRKLPKRMLSPAPSDDGAKKKNGNETKKAKLVLEGKDYAFKTLSGSGKFRWEEIEGGQAYCMTTEGCQPKAKIAAFDMDSTLITTSSGRVFPKDRDDWKLLFSEVPGKLKQLHEQDDCKIVVFTNQAGMARGKVKLEDFRWKVENIAGRLSVPFQLFCCATDGGMLRKPRLGAWRCLQQKNDGVDIDMAESFYCGDAAGREKDWAPGRKKDFSCSDRLFAMNLDLRFLTPEEFFLGQKATKRFKLPEFDPKSARTDVELLEPSSAELIAKQQEVVLLVGIQGSGKSHLASSKFEPAGYALASNDRSGGRDKTLRILDQALSAGKSVVVDNTHGDKETRKKYLDVVAKHRGVKCRAFVMKTSPQHARHNNLFRELTGREHVRIKEPLFNAYISRYQEPTIDEGFSEIVKVNFLPEFKSAEEERLYRLYLQER